MQSKLVLLIVALGLFAGACQSVSTGQAGPTPPQQAATSASAAPKPSAAAAAAPSSAPGPSPSALAASPSPSAPAASPSPSAVAVSPVPAAAVPTPFAGPTVSLTTSYSALIGANLPVWMDSEAGIDKLNGLDITQQYIASSTGLPALLSGQVQIANVGGSEALSAAVGGADIVNLGTTLPVYPFVMMAPASINNVDELRGKKIGVSQVGSTSDTATRVLLRTAGLDPDKDVTIVAVGSLSNRIAALRDGAIDAGVAQPPEQLALQQLGFHIVYDLAAQKVPAAGGGVVVMRSWLESHRDVAQRYIDSLIESSVKVRQDRQLAIQVLSKYLQNDDQDALGNTYDFFVNSVIPIYPTVSADQYKDTIDQLAANNPRVKDVDLSKFLDNSFVENAMQRHVGGQ